MFAVGFVVSSSAKVCSIRCDRDFFFKGEGGRFHDRRMTARRIEKEIKVGTNKQRDSFHVA